MESRRIAECIAAFAREKKADDVLILDMSRVSGICDYFVIGSAASVIRARTVAENIETQMKEIGLRLSHRDGFSEGKWIVLDFGEVIAHIFQEERRRYYDLEHLWGDAPRRQFLESASV